MRASDYCQVLVGFALCTLSALITGCGGGGSGGGGSQSTQPTPPASPVVIVGTADAASGSVGKLGGSLATSTSSIRLSVPENALDTAATLGIAPADIVVPQGTVGGPIVELSPSGTKFNIPVKLTLRYEASLLPVGSVEQNLTIAVLNSGQWQDVATSVDTASKTLSADLTHFSTYTYKISDASRQLYGTVLGSFNGVIAYSNGCIDPSKPECGSHPDTYNTANAGGYNTGLQWQCVEFINRYHYQVYGTRIRIAGDDANQYFKGASARGLLAYQNSGPVPPRPGDIIVSEGKTTNVGHVAIVRDVNQTEVVVVQQNWSESTADLGHRLTLKVVGNKYVVGDFSPSYPVTGWLRSPKSTQNDTGLTACRGPSGEVSCSSAAAYLSQDANTGRDKSAADGTLRKLGSGRAGFDFTKIGADGITLEASAAAWACARDNISGLVWEIKTRDGGLRDRGWVYSWYETDNTKNGGVPGSLNPTPDSSYGKPFNPSTKTNTWCGGSLANCNTRDYMAAVNASKLCGFSDWRLPTFLESVDLIDWSSFTASYLSEDFVFIPGTQYAFPLWGGDPDYTVFTDAFNGEKYYRSRWTGSHDPSGSLSRGNAARVLTMSGDWNQAAAFKDGANGIRLVRGGIVAPMSTLNGQTGRNGGENQGCELSIPAAAPDERYQIAADGTVLDIVTNLVWKQCLEGQSGTTCSSGTPGAYSRQEAQAIADKSRFAGISGWRLPTLKELGSTQEPRCVNPSVNLKAFPGPVGSQTSGARLWTSSFGGAGSSPGIGPLVLSYTNSGDPYVSDTAFVRLVRDR